MSAHKTHVKMGERATILLVDTRANASLAFKERTVKTVSNEKDKK